MMELMDFAASIANTGLKFQRPYNQFVESVKTIFASAEVDLENQDIHHIVVAVTRELDKVIKPCWVDILADIIDGKDTLAVKQ